MEKMRQTNKDNMQESQGACVSKHVAITDIQ